MKLSILNISIITDQDLNFAADVAAVQNIPVIGQLLDVICQTTGMGFSAIARVTEEHWMACAVDDRLSFGIRPGDELELKSTLCDDVRKSRETIVIDHVDKSALYCDHHTPKKYQFQSYISVPIFRKDGSFFGTLCALDPDPNQLDKPEILSMFHLYTDLIAFHLEAVTQLESSAEKLREEKRNAAFREQFIAILGHDLKNPIAATRMGADMLLLQAKDDKTKKLATMLKSTSLRMNRLIENLLDFARGRFGEGIVLERKPHSDSLQEILGQVITELHVNAPDRKVSREISIEHPVCCDRERVGQLFGNLLNNANIHGSKEAPIRISARTTENLFELQVVNKGEKIPETAKKDLFEPFYRKHSKPSKGLGLGLFIASEIAKAHGGTIEVESTMEETCFSFLMPLE